MGLAGGLKPVRAPATLYGSLLLTFQPTLPQSMSPIGAEKKKLGQIKRCGKKYFHEKIVKFLSAHGANFHNWDWRDGTKRKHFQENGNHFLAF